MNRLPQETKLKLKTHPPDEGPSPESNGFLLKSCTNYALHSTGAAIRYQVLLALLHRKVGRIYDLLECEHFSGLCPNLPLPELSSKSLGIISLTQCGNFLYHSFPRPPEKKKKGCQGPDPTPN
jgi:hypothetical protein